MFEKFYFNEFRYSKPHCYVRSEFIKNRFNFCTFDTSFFIVASCLFSHTFFILANGVTITTKSNNKTVLSGTKLELEWTVNVSPGDTSILISVFLSPDFTNAILVDGSVKEKSLKLFGKNRLSATFENLTYTMSLMDVKYNESGTFRLDVVFRNNGLKDTQSDTYVSVTGRLYKVTNNCPKLCGILQNLICV